MKKGSHKDDNENCVIKMVLIIWNMEPFQHVWYEKTISWMDLRVNCYLQEQEPSKSSGIIISFINIQTVQMYVATTG